MVLILSCFMVVATVIFDLVEYQQIRWGDLIVAALFTPALVLIMIPFTKNTKKKTGVNNKNRNMKTLQYLSFEAVQYYALYFKSNYQHAHWNKFAEWVSRFENVSKLTDGNFEIIYKNRSREVYGDLIPWDYFKKQ